MYSGLFDILLGYDSWKYMYIKCKLHLSIYFNIFSIHFHQHYCNIISLKICVVYVQIFSLTGCSYCTSVYSLMVN